MPELVGSDPTETQNWIVSGDGECKAFYPQEPDIPEKPYRLYRFLTDLEDVLEEIPDDHGRLQAICPLVRKLLTSSYWLQMENPPASPKTGWGVKFLYKEPKFPLTVQMVTWLPGQVSTVHNHATWGVVALVSGEEKNTLWKRAGDPHNKDRIEAVGEQILVPGDIIGFTGDAIHCVEPLGESPTISFNLYGLTNYERRFKFDPNNHTAVKF